ncbi:P-loop containing nucleoside triphosphate hydrolase protein [Penicillium lividum]|nr:P-loop containing nucleoside triphosphate hydrolase protein [Penicillium lividum]
MASISFGHGNTNSGTQVGINYGSIQLSQKRERPETPPPPLSNVPFRRDPDFVDRGALLDQIYERGTTPEARIALVGLGGVGKSQLAIECCYRIREHSPETWVFWIHAGNAARFEQSCLDIAERVRIPGRRDSTNIFKLIHNWLVDERHGKWVLILDNVDDSRFLNEAPPASQSGQSDHSGAASGQPLLTFLPISYNGSIIITSRSRDAVSSIVEDDDIITIEPMVPSHASMLFEKKLGVQAQDITLELVTALDYMPLAIVQAASYIRQRTPRLTVQQYLEEFVKSDRKRTSLLAYEGGKLRRDREAKNSILITWQISFDHIQHTRPAAADLLSLMCFFDRQGIPGPILQHQPAKENDKEYVTSDDKMNLYNDEFEDSIVTLRNYSMIFIDLDGETFGMHRLVQLAMRSWLEAKGQLEHWKQKFIDILFYAFPSNGDFENWATCQPLFAHVQSLITQRPDGDTSLSKWASVLHRSSNFMLQKGNLITSEQMGVLALETNLRLLGPGDPNTLANMSDLASIYCNQGRWKEAEDLQVQVLEITKLVFGLEHPITLTSMNNLSMTYRDLGRRKEAEDLQVQVLEIRKQILGPEHSDTGAIMSNLAMTYLKQGRWKEAEDLQVQVLEIRKQILGPEHPKTLTSMSNFASAYWNQGRWKEAEDLQVQVLEIRKQILGPEHPDTLTSMHNLAYILRSLGRNEAALQLMAECVRLRRRMLGPDHLDTTLSICFLNEWGA